MKRTGIYYVGNFLSASGNTPQPAEALIEPFRKDFRFVHASGKKNIYARYLDMIFTYLRNRHKIDVCIIDVYSGLAFYYALTMATLSRMFSIQYFLVIHGGNFSARLLGSRKLSAFLLRPASRIIAPSGYISEMLDQQGYASIQIPNPVDLRACRFKQRLQFSPNLLWVRSFLNTYHPCMAIKILYQLIRSGLPARLTMVGPKRDGSLDEVIRLIERYGIGEYVTLTGLIPKNEWYGLADSHDFFINTSVIDNMPVSIMEAMAKGLVVVSSNVGGIPYLIRDSVTGFLKQPDDVDAFSNQIIYCLKRENAGEMAALTERASKDIEQYDIREVFNRWKSEIRETTAE